jgi:hypothetical protein
MLAHTRHGAFGWVLCDRNNPCVARTDSSHQTPYWAKPDMNGLWTRLDAVKFRPPQSPLEEVLET